MSLSKLLERNTKNKVKKSSLGRKLSPQESAKAAGGRFEATW